MCLSGIGNVPSPNVRPDIWDCVESYAIHMLLTRRLKIIPTSNLKLIISFLVLHILLLPFIKLLSVVASKQYAHLTSRTVLRLANRPSAQFANSSKQGQPPSNGDPIYLFSSPGRILVLRVSHCGALLEPKVTSLFSATIYSMQEIEKISTKCLLTRTKFQQFLSKAPRSIFKKLIISTPLLL